MEEAIENNRIWFGKDGNGAPRIKKYLAESEDAGLTPETIWYADDVGTTDTAKKHALELLQDSTVFETPKPEELLQRILAIATNPTDVVLDSFLGSGTTAAVANKLGRKWIGIELGEHATTHCLPRLQGVIRGEDKGGITKSVGWKGGGGFKFYTLAPSLIQKDKYGSEIINPAYNPNMLAAAMAKQEGFRYSPNESNYWKQGFSSEKDFIFTTTQFITVQMLDKLHEEMKPGESLLICCKSFKKECQNRYNNITIKKIPQMLLGRCEFGKDDYSLNIVNLPHDDINVPEESSEQVIEVKGPKSSKKKSSGENQSLLF
jgi:adenine-specific DNA-methyltransferase